MEDCVELEHDIKMYLSLETSPINIEFWEAMAVVCKHHLEMLRDPERAAGGRLYNKDVDESASKIVNGLSLQRLSELEDRTHAMLNSGGPVDGEFWDLVLKKITVAKAIVSDHCFEIILSLGPILTPRQNSARSTRLSSRTAWSSSRSGSARTPRAPRPRWAA